MGNLLTRRREMMQAASVPSAPLYSFDDRNFIINAANTPNSYLNVSNGNHFVYYGRNRGNDYQCFADLTNTSKKIQSSWPGIFSVSAGDFLEMKLKDGYVHSDQSARYNGYAQCSLRTSDDSFVAGWSDTSSEAPLYVVGKQKKEFSELSYTKTFTEPATINSIRIRNYGSAQAMYITLVFDLEVYVNGVRYI